MNTNHLKKFAQEARRKLLEQVGAKLTFVLTTDSVELREKTEQLKQLRQELGRTTKEQLIEKVAYTWFNRLMALRFMDANDYQPLGIRIITPKDGYTIPELLDEAKRGNISEELRVNRQKIYDLLDGKIPSSNPQNEAFKELLIAACNHLNTSFPFLFEKINDFTELLLPDDLTSDFSTLKNVRDGMLIEDCKNVEIIGWLYQFYISQKKDEVFASKSKVKKEDIPAATQLFTPRWIVEYMVQNTLGKLWLQNRPKSRLRQYMPYLIESASLEAEEYIKVQSPEEIKFLEPACGSGHILVYAFDLFSKIYEEEGYNTSEIPKLIIENNLYGFEIDERAAQLSALALMIKAREYNSRAFRIELMPNILCYNDLYVTKNEIIEILHSQIIHISDDLLHDLLLMQHATNFGSLIIPHTHISEIERVLVKLTQFLPDSDVFQRSNVEAIIGSLNRLKLLAQKFHCLVANPPYMGFSKMNLELSSYLRIEYQESKQDLMTSFMDRSNIFLIENGYFSMINLPSWMFLSSFEEFRKKFLVNNNIVSLLHLGRGIFGADFGTVAFSCKKSSNIAVSGVYRRLFKEHVQVRKTEEIRRLFLNTTYGYYTAKQKDFLKISGAPIAYWASKRIKDIFINSEELSKYADSFQGIITGNNEKLLRYWFEINSTLTDFQAKDFNSVELSKAYWFPYNKGGKFRKWYGNHDYVINWKTKGVDFTRGKNSFSKYFFKEYFSWTYLSSSTLATRYYPDGFLWDVHGSGAFPYKQEDIFYLLGLISSKVGLALLSIINPTISFQVENIVALPVIKPDNEILKNQIIESIHKCINISKEDWDNFETSWNFKTFPLLRDSGQFDIAEAIEYFKQIWATKFKELHSQEELINERYLEVYGLTQELDSKIPIKDITILDDISKINHGGLEIENKKLIENYISYAVGCMFGRYSLDKKGLIVASEGETFHKFLNKIDKTIKECSYLPDVDNIIPVLEDDWFEDDIVGKFNQFLRVTFGEKYFNKNLTFIEEQIGKDIRNYFLRDFYPDHIKRYKKRPIYWMFSSPKGSFNVLIYMHRYTPDTVSNILNKYLKEFIGKLNTRKEHIDRVKETGTASEKSKAIKESDNIQKILVELHEYERDILYPLATERIEIDLDDGVLVNYNKFGKAVKEVNGLNDPATKKKVKQFDWIDTSQIK